MTENTTNVKRGKVGSVINFVDCHPRTGWYISIMLSVNVILNILDLFH